MERIVLTEEARKQAENEFKGMFSRNIKRDGARGLLKWLEYTDFFVAPAGMKHHGAFRGGLLMHSINVYKELRSYSDSDSDYLTPEEEETKAICGLLHDVCKVGVYHLGEDGRYTYRDPFPMGHGEKSVLLLSRYIHLTEEEALAIRWHMGPYDDAAKGGSRDLDAAMSFSPLVYALHAADMRAMLAERQRGARDGR